jgi:transcriptional regulator with XRE-family HTH domain
MTTAVAGLALGDRVKELRQAHRPPLTQRELSRRLGVADSYIGQVERGDVTLPSVQVLRGLARELGTTTLDLLQAAGYLDGRELGDVLDDPAYSLALRQAAGLTDEALRRMVVSVIQRAAELEAERDRGGHPRGTRSAN